MDYKEKYNNALDWMRSVYPTLTGADKEDAEHYFPELAESEDERIRKRIYGLIYHNDALLDKDELLAYLEKQKEQKPQGVYVDCTEHPDWYGISSNEQKPAEWSDTDNIGWDEAFACVTRAEKIAKNEEELQNAVTAEKWLKEIKFKYCVHPVKQEWSEEDEMYLSQAIETLEHENYSILAEKLKSLRPQPKAELTLLDENIIAAAVAFVEQNNHFNFWRGIDKHTVIKALRSLKPHWKPSEEQMEALRYVKQFNYGGYRSELESLYNDLKKL